MTDATESLRVRPHPSPRERATSGRAARAWVPRSSHAAHSPAAYLGGDSFDRALTDFAEKYATVPGAPTRSGVPVGLRRTRPPGNLPGRHGSAFATREQGACRIAAESARERHLDLDAARRVGGQDCGHHRRLGLVAMDAGGGDLLPVHEELQVLRPARPQAHRDRAACVLAVKVILATHGRLPEAPGDESLSLHRGTV